MASTSVHRKIGRAGRIHAPRGNRVEHSMTSSHLMTDGEFDAFWYRHDARFSPLRDVYVEADTDSEAEALVVSILSRSCEVQMVSVSSARSSKGAGRGRSARSNRCGSCVACAARDCGTCKNCRDKPRFGGPGIKKKACLSRICRNATVRGGDADADDANDAAGEGEEGEEGEEAQPEMKQQLHIDVGVADTGAHDDRSLASILDACKRQPLTPLRHSTSSGNLQGFDMLARTALQTIPC